MAKTIVLDREVYTVRELAGVLELNPKTLYKQITSGKLATIHLGMTLVTKAAAAAYIETYYGKAGRQPKEST